MKKDLHPTYYEKAKVTCVCGATFIIGSTKEHITTEICSQCHPFFTGTEKMIDIAGKVERFKSRRVKAGTTTAPKKADRRKAVKAKKVADAKKAAK